MWKDKEEERVNSKELRLKPRSRVGLFMMTLIASASLFSSLSTLLMMASQFLTIWLTVVTNKEDAAVL